MFSADSLFYSTNRKGRCLIVDCTEKKEFELHARLYTFLFCGYYKVN